MTNRSRAGIWCRRWLPAFLLALPVLGIACAPLGLYCSFIERLTHLRLYWLPALTILCLYWGLRKRWRPAIVSAALVIAGLPGVLRYYRPPPGPTGSPALTFSIAAWNVHSSNLQRDRAVAWLTSLDADVLLLTEVNPGWAKHLDAVTRRWPHEIREERNGAAGIWLLSRWPLGAPAPGGLRRNQDKPWIDCTLTTPAGQVRLFAMHPPTPRGGSFAARNAQLTSVAGLAAASPDPVIVFGDLNCTPFSPWFDRLLTTGGLTDTAAGRGFTPTWQRNVSFLPIDHILTRGPLVTQDRRVEPDDLGSDHHPVLATLSLTK